MFPVIGCKFSGCHSQPKNLHESKQTVRNESEPREKKSLPCASLGSRHKSVKSICSVCWWSAERQTKKHLSSSPFRIHYLFISTLIGSYFVNDRQLFRTVSRASAMIQKTNRIIIRVSILPSLASDYWKNTDTHPQSPHIRQCFLPTLVLCHIFTIYRLYA